MVLYTVIVTANWFTNYYFFLHSFFQAYIWEFTLVNTNSYIDKYCITDVLETFLHHAHVQSLQTCAWVRTSVAVLLYRKANLPAHLEKDNISVSVSTARSSVIMLMIPHILHATYSISYNLMYSNVFSTGAVHEIFTVNTYHEFFYVIFRFIFQTGISPLYNCKCLETRYHQHC